MLKNQIYKDYRSQIFLLGCPRSGTTLLQSFLAAHPLILSFPETQFLPIIIGQQEPRYFGSLASNPPYGLTKKIKTATRILLGLSTHNAQNRFTEFHSNSKVACSKIIPNFEHRTKRIKPIIYEFISHLDNLTLQANKLIWAEKTPDNINYIDIIEKYIPGANIIHIYREGKSVIGSLWDMASTYKIIWGKQYYSIERCISRWNIAISNSIKCINKKNHFCVKYEMLVAGPVKVLKALSSWIGIPYSPNMIKDRINITSNIITENEPWKNNVFRKIFSTNNDKFNKLFNFEDQQKISSKLIKLDALNQWAEECIQKN